MARRIKKTECVIYARYSGDSWDDSTSLVKQVELCREYATDQGWKIKGTYRDTGYTGDQVDRPGLIEAIADLLPGDVLLCLSADRFAKTVRVDAINTVRVEHVGGVVHFVQGGEPKVSPEKAMFMRTFMDMDDFKRSITKKRQSKSHKAAIQKGTYKFGKAPYGWKLTPNRRTVIDEGEQEILNIILDLYRSGLNKSAIATYLNECGYKNRSGGEWHRMQVTRIVDRDDRGLIPPMRKGYDSNKKS